jgi:DNA-binding IclR family transcriptional regulator
MNAPHETLFDGRGLQSVSITCDVLHAVSALDRPTLGEIAEEVDTSKSTVHKHLHTLINNDLVIRYSDENPICIGDPPTQPVYLLSLKHLGRGERLRREEYPMAAIEPQVRSLAERTGELATFAVPEYGAVVFVAQDGPGDAVEVVGGVRGDRRPMHATAHGKAIIAQYDDEDALDDRWVREALTDETITDADRFRQAIEDVREQGYAIDRGETVERVNGIAAPVVVSGRVVGAVGVYGPADRLPEERLHDAVQRDVVGAATAIEIDAASE